MNNKSDGISLCWFGDVKIDDAINLEIGKKLNHLIESSNFNIVNFEAPVRINGGRPIDKSGPIISQGLDSISWLEKNGFKSASLANNHCMDYGIEGLKTTKRSFKSISVVGAGSWDEAYKPLIVECGDNCKIAIIAASHCEFGTLTENTTDSYGYAWLLHPQIESIIIESKNKYDYVFLFAHAGIEREEQPLPEIRRLYRHFIDLGCDGVIASHPHIVQGWEFYHEKPIVYSLGNFIFDDEEADDSWNISICCNVVINNTININIYPIKYDPSSHIVDILDDINYDIHLQEVNNTLVNYELYMNSVNKYCLSILPIYYSYLANGGFVHPVKIFAGIKGLLGFLKGGRCFTKKHLLNTIRCESHRWALIRALKLKYNIKF